MRSFNWLPVGPALDRLRTWIHRYHERSPAQRRAIRWGFSVAALSVAALIGFLSTASLTTTAKTYLGMGRRYSWDDLSKISRTLDRQRTGYTIDDRRVAVPLSQREEAEAAIAKLDLGSRPPGEIRDQSAAPGLFDSPHDKELREHREREKILEAMISDLGGIVGSFVRIEHPKARLGLQPAARSSAFVRLETEGDRQLPFQSVQKITTILTGFEPGLSAEAITVVDRRGHKYLDAGNPALSVLSSNRAEEESLSEQILEQLDWIKGVRVSVQLPGGAGMDLAAARESARQQRSERTSQPQADSTPSLSGPSSRGPETAPPVITINRPLEVTEFVANPVSSPPADRGAAPRPTRVEPGRVWIKVPRSYYYQTSISPSHKEPSHEELQKLVVRTDEQIRTGLAFVVPLSGSGAWKTTIDVIPDRLPLDSPEIVAGPPDPRPRGLDWRVPVVIGAGAALALIVCWIILSTRRPAIDPEASPRGVRYHRGTAASPGPSERVREFVRRNPESAVSVIERWTSQGGGES